MRPLPLAKYLISFLLISLLFSCNKGKQAIEFSGHLDGVIEKKIYLTKISPEGPLLIDSSFIHKGNFSLKVVTHSKSERINAENPSFYQIYLTKDNGFTTLARAGDHLIFKANAAHLVQSYSVQGSDDALLMYQLDAQLKSFIDSTDNLYKIYELYPYNDSVKERIEQNYNRLVDEHTRFLLSFINRNKNSLAVITAFYQKYNRRIFLPETENVALLLSIYNNLKVQYPDNENVLFLEQRLQTLNKTSNQ